MLDKKQLHKLIFIRKVEEFIAEIYQEQKIRCPVHLSIGHEAVAVGVCNHLDKEDKIFSYHRSHAHYFAKGGELREFFAELMGKSTGCSKGQGGSMHLSFPEKGFMGATSIVAGTIPVAVGLSYAQKLKKQDNVCACFFGDGAVEEGVFWESLNLASKFELPILFCLENNNMACYTNIETRRKRIKIKELCNVLDIKYSYFENGWDLLDINKRMSEVISEMKDTKRPHFCEFNVFRRFEHCGPEIDDHLNYRSKEEIGEWDRKDPIAFIKKNCQFIFKNEKEFDVWFSDIEKEINNTIRKAYEMANNDPWPEPKSYGE